MASGYEKAACGVDPAEGWRTPSPGEAWAAAALALALGGAPWILGLIVPVLGILGR